MSIEARRQKLNQSRRERKERAKWKADRTLFEERLIGAARPVWDLDIIEDNDTQAWAGKKF